MTAATATTTAPAGPRTLPPLGPTRKLKVPKQAERTLRNGLTVAWTDGRVHTFPERKAPSGGRAYWGVSHELLIRDFYARLNDPEPFWISPAEALKSLELLKRTYEVAGAGS